MEIKTVTTKPETLTRKVAASKLPGGYLNTIDRAITDDEIDYCWIGGSKLIVVNKKWNDFIKRKTQDPYNWKGNADNVNYK